MTYNPNVPQAGDIISQTQDPILTNFQQLNLVYGDENPPADPNSDHFAYDDATANSRKHRKVRLPATTAFPTPAATDGVIYTKDASGQTIPYYRKDTGTLDFPVLPIRAMVRFTNANPPVVVGTAFNATPSFVGGSSFRVTFSENLPDANYVVVMSTSRATAPATESVIISGSTLVNQFDLLISTLVTEIHVIVLHYL